MSGPAVDGLNAAGRVMSTRPDVFDSEDLMWVNRALDHASAESDELKALEHIASERAMVLDEICDRYSLDKHCPQLINLLAAKQARYMDRIQRERADLRALRAGPLV